MNPLDYFWLFLKGSLLSTGGLGNLPFLHKDLLGLGWAAESDFVTAIAVGQLSPGPTGLWSISLGYLTYGWLGAGLALVALSLPPLLTLGVAAIYSRIENLKAVQDFMRGLSLGIIGLTLTVTLGLATTTVVDLRGLGIALAALGLALSRKIPAVWILVLAAVAGCLLYGF
jgi:chromate transporter